MAEEQKRRIVFMGTPDFAAVILSRLLEWNGGEVVGVFTQPDKKSGRGMRLAPSAVKTLALERNLPVFQPASLRSPESREPVSSLRPDFLVVASYGLILPQAVLDAAAIAPINVHASLLPKYRGAAPIQRAIMENYGPDAKTGVSIMKMVKELDAGPVYLQKSVAIGRKDCGELSRELAESGAEALIGALEKLAHERFEPRPQDEAGATYAHKLVREDGIIDWHKNAAGIEALIRAVTPWPGAQARFELDGSAAAIPVTVLGATVGDPCPDEIPGRILRGKNTLAVACGDKWLNIEKVRPNNRGAMSAQAFANGYCKIKNGPCGNAL